MSKNKTHIYNNGKTYRSVSTYDFKTGFSKYIREMNADDYDGVIVTSYDRPVGIFMPASRMLNITKRS